MAQRTKNADGSLGDWRHHQLSHRRWHGARRIAQALLNRGLSADRPVVMLSENDLEHALLSLGCLVAGVPYCSASPAYSTVSTDYDKLRHAIATLTPGLVFASDGQRYAAAIDSRGGAPTVRWSLIAGYLHATGPQHHAFQRNCLPPKPRPPWTPHTPPSRATASPSSCSPRAPPRRPRP
ncbi:MAG: hypothetical protein U5L46_06785 [Agrobacterium sp.]|nr:hypothetical protein [Agrobacterium sp.]